MSTGSGVRRKVKMEDFGKELGIILKAYEADLDDQLKKDIRAAGRVALKEVKKPPAGAEKYRNWDEYSKGWHTKTEQKFGVFAIRIRNTEKPGLTHLLEKGHINRDGKTYSKRFPHIGHAAQEAEKELTRRIHEHVKK